MVITSHIAPHPILSAYVVSYCLSEFDTAGVDIKRPWHATYHTSITFFFNTKSIILCDPINGKIIKMGNHINILGLSSIYNGEIIFNGSYKIFEIALKPTGLNDIVGIPEAEIRNHIVEGCHLLDFDINLLYERLSDATDIKEMGLLADAYLLHNLFKNSQAGFDKNLLKIVGYIVNSCGQANLDQLAFHANMSNRNLERIFINKVGVSPKHLICIVRFTLALSRKKKNPTTDWTSIAAESGYFDQMHMIREFKSLSGHTPSNLIKIPLITETISSYHLST